MIILQADIDLDAGPTKGSIVYNAVDDNITTSDIKGLIVTTFYFHDKYQGQDQAYTKTDIYKKGILHMLSVTEDPTFAGWKLLIYTDQTSIDTPYSSTTTNLAMHQEEWSIIKGHKNTIFGIVQSPEYAVGGGTDTNTIDNAILRAFRMRAFHDFNAIPVFIRDADTLFENIVKILDGGRPARFKQEMIAWEKTFWENLKGLPPQTFVIASQPNYHRQWHVDPATGVSTTGCYAALTSTLGNVTEWVDGSMWRKCLAYLRNYSKVVNEGGTRKPSNSALPTYIGKDEQLLSYVIIRTMLPKVYFYYLEYIQVEGIKITTSDATPFADEIIKSNLLPEPRYPSPYIKVLGEALPDLETSATLKRKDENVKTEETILKPEIIPLSFSPVTNKLMHIVFQYYVDKMAQVVVTTTLSGGGMKLQRQAKRQAKRQATRRQAKRQAKRQATRRQATRRQATRQRQSKAKRRYSRR